MKRIGAVAIGVLFVACADSPSAPSGDGVPEAAFAATTYMANVSEPLQLDVYIECAAGGAGETVRLEGMLHSIFRLTFDAQGGVHGTFHDQPQQLSGTGLTTGTLYQGTGVTRDVANVGAAGLPAVFTFVNKYRIIGQGPGNDFIAHITSHYTINANGDVTVSVDHATFDCR